MDLFFVTGNPKKILEVSRLIDDRINLVSKDLQIEEIQSNSLERISADKAIKAFEILQKPLIVEDSGVYFDDYVNFPGAFSKYMFQSLGFAGFEKLFADSVNKTGKMVAVTSYIEPGMDEVKQFVGEVKGKFDFSNLDEDADSLPFNNIFVPDGYNKKVIEMYDEWATINHRANAIKKLNQFLERKLG